MKFGSHSFIFTDHWSDQSLSILDQAKALGLDCLEIGIGDDVHFTPALTRQRAEALGLDLIISPGNEWPLECDLSSVDPANRAAGLAWHKRQVDLAAELGALAYGGSLYGRTGVVKKERPDPDEFARIASGLYSLAEYGAANNITIVLEPMSHFRTHILNTPQQTMALLDQVDHDNLYVLLDTYHMVTEVLDYAEAIKCVGDRLWSIHACESDRGVPGRGLVPWADVFQGLREINYGGYVMLESYNSAINDGNFAYGRGLFHNVCADAENFVQEGIGFLKHGLQ